MIPCSMLLLHVVAFNKLYLLFRTTTTDYSNREKKKINFEKNKEFIAFITYVKVRVICLRHYIPGALLAGDSPAF